jgi:hypothetical protein
MPGAVIGGSVVGYRPVVTYEGPGDVVSGATAWWGLRAYSSATIGDNAVRLRRDSDNAEQNFTTLANGSLDVASIATFKGAANLFVVTLYDQTGNGLDTTQSTAASQPKFLLSILGSWPVVQSDQGFNTFLSGNYTGATISQPYCFAQVMQNTNTTGARVDPFIFDGGPVGDYFGNGTQYNLYSGIGSPYVIAANTWIAYGSFYQTPISNLYQDGVAGTPAQTGSNTVAAGTFNYPFRTSFVGDKLNWVEGGLWPSDIQAGFASLSANQHSYWGF